MVSVSTDSKMNIINPVEKLHCSAGKAETQYTDSCVHCAYMLTVHR